MTLIFKPAQQVLLSAETTQEQYEEAINTFFPFGRPAGLARSGSLQFSQQLSEVLDTLKNLEHLPFIMFHSVELDPVTAEKAPMPPEYKHLTVVTYFREVPDVVCKTPMKRWVWLYASATSDGMNFDLAGKHAGFLDTSPTTLYPRLAPHYTKQTPKNLIPNNIFSAEVLLEEDLTTLGNTLKEESIKVFNGLVCKQASNLNAVYNNF